MNDQIKISICEKEDEVLELEKWYGKYSLEITKNLQMDFSKENQRLYKVEFKNEIIGIGCVTDRKIIFEEFRRFLDPNWRHKKIGDLLLDYIIEDAKFKKVKNLTGSYHGEDQKVLDYFDSKGFKYGPLFGVIYLKMKIDKEGNIEPPQNDS